MKKNLSKTVKASIFFLALLFSLSAARAATGTMNIGGGSHSDLTVDGSGTGWTWNAATETLTVNADYTGDYYIIFKCAETDHVNMLVTANLTIRYISSWGSLSLDASDYTLNITGVTNVYGIRASKHLSITGGTFHVTGANAAIQSGDSEGDISISGTVNITAVGAIRAPGGSMSVSITGTITAEYVKGTIKAKNDITVSSGSLFLTSTSLDDAMSIGSNDGNVFITGNANLTAIGGIYNNDGSLTINTSGTVNIECLTYIGVFTGADINIISGTVNVLVGDMAALYAMAAINVSGGATTLTGTGTLIQGVLNHTGGTINGQGPPSIPTVVTGAITDITDYSATVSGSVTDNGGSSIIEKKIMCRLGVAIFEEPAYGADDNFSANITGLQGNTVYEVCAAARNYEGWGYGEWKEFTTDEEPLLIDIPVVATGTITASLTTATVSGNVIDNHGATVVAYKIEYRKTGESTIQEVIATGNDAEFSATLTDLAPESQYSVRAAAQNSEGWGYGEWKIFLTNDNPTVIDVSVSPAEVSVKKGETQAFTAAVSVANGASTEVVWSIAGGGAGTSVSASGLLMVAITETATTITITATSVFDPTKKGTATVTVKEVAGIDEIETTAFVIYPNPTSDKLRMENGEWRICGVEI
ncbi:fibronectin type III domain-containing protein, partial [Bacteroidales bacterium OttesenSCG-928-K22]|nr:fibronectin type III domain-containing protein [Bacteroidales bacterium OttesenSCG-928-L14]MDL2241262.1 fibronectin type III domain-containing protein [Bacteroidales bacterium OttesenSCG-928-K22]